MCLELERRAAVLKLNHFYKSVVFSDIIVFMIHLYKRVDQCVNLELVKLQL